MNEIKKINAVVFDYGLTIGAEYYFNIKHPQIPNWNEIIQRIVFKNQKFIDKWLVGETAIDDIAKQIESETGINRNSILDILKKGCMKIKENKEVIDFAWSLKKKRFPIAMVTLNFDVFNEIIIPYHNYDSVFDIIINSCDFKEMDKKKLWPKAFDRLGIEINYQNSLLIEDSEYEVNRFLSMGGNAILYNKNMDFEKELAKYQFLESN